LRLGPKGERIFWMGCGGGNAGDVTMCQTDRTGKMIPFETTAQESNRRIKGRLMNFPGGNTAWERDFCVDRQGNLYVKNRGKQYHGHHKVDKYAPDGKYLETVLWCVSDGAFGPKVDPKGNLYIADGLKPAAGVKWPKEFDGRLPNKYTEQIYNWICGSVVKFGPKGGAVWYPKAGPYAYEGNPDGSGGGYPEAEKVPFAREVKLDASLAKTPASWWGSKKEPTQLQGALWQHFGFSPVEDMGPAGDGIGCHCTGTDFDTDDFGRSFYPDQARFRAAVLDTNGNEILHIGAYGNQDFCGPDSYVLDPKEKYYRPRRPDDPKDLKSPFAEPEIAFSWITGMAVTDRHLYVADALNKRVLKVKLDYAATETVAVP
jgi:hypothetical protein